MPTVLITGTNLLKTQPLTLSCPNQGFAITCTFNPPTIVAGQSSILTMSFISGMVPGTFAVPVAGSYPASTWWGLVTQSTNVSVTVAAPAATAPGIPAAAMKRTHAGTGHTQRCRKRGRLHAA